MENQQNNGEYKKIIEAALFVSGRAMSADELAQALGISSPGMVGGMADELVEEYGSRDSSLYIMKLGGKYMLAVREQYIGRVNSLGGAPDISRGALRILAYISKDEPAMQSTIVKAFGPSSYDYIKELVEKEFVTAKRSGRTKKLETTEKFKEYFSLGPEGGAAQP